MIELDEEIKIKLRSAGWNEAYRADPKPHLLWNEQQGYPPNPYAEEFFSHFGGLTISITDGLNIAYFTTDVASHTPQHGESIVFQPGQETFCICGWQYGIPGVLDLYIRAHGKYIVHYFDGKIVCDNINDALRECLSEEWLGY
jgi:hypothetical protein